MKNIRDNEEQAAVLTEDPNVFLTVQKLANRWQCCVESVRRDIRAKRLKSVYRYGKHLISMKEIARVESESTLPLN